MEIPSLGLNYSTPPQNLPLYMRLSPLITFYLTSFKVLYCANRDAVKGNYPTERWVADSEAILRCIEKASGKFVAEGMEMFTQTEGPCVFVANHMSTLETFCLPILIRPFKEVSYIVKSSLVSFPFFGAVMQSRNPILLDRVNPREDFAKSMKEGVAMLESGCSLIIFPQGTRIKEFKEQDFNSLGAKIAKKANVPLVPIALKTDFWGLGWPIKDFGFIYPERTVHFKFGEPMRIEGSGKEEHATCVNFIKSNLDKWIAEDNK